MTQPFRFLAAAVVLAWCSTAPAATPAAGADPIVDASGTVVPAAYKAMGARLGTAEGIEYRFGPASTIPDSAIPNSYYQPPSSGNAKSPCCNPNGFGSWQVGGPVSVDPGPYFSNMATAMFVTEDPAKSPGVSVLQTTAAGHNTFAQKPQWSWIYMDGVFDPSIQEYKSQGKDVSHPTALGRCAGRPGWCVVGIAGFQNGLIGTTRGSNTAHSRSTAQLAPGLVPTAIDVTNGSEFALVTVWDTANVRGRVAVVALTGLCNGCNLSNYVNEPEQYWGEWKMPYPGLTNLGNIGFMKLLGYVDLPDMKAPTGISVTTGWNPWTSQVRPSERDLSPLSNESNRQTFISGANKDKFAKTGIAVVISKSEQKATFIDLKPLFAYYRKMYFGARRDFDRTAGVGPAPAQWPFLFGDAPEQVPTVIKTVNLGARPTAVKAALWNANRAWIATQEGRLRIFDLGGYTTIGNASPKQIVERGSVAVGKNPTGLAYFRAEVNSTNNAINSKLIVVSRGDRKVQWIDFDADNNGGKVVRELQDKNLKDPITADDQESNGSYAAVVMVADYNGRGISGYRYDTLKLHDGFAACQPDGCPTRDAQGRPAAFEWGGKLDLPGKPFGIRGGNAP